MRISPTRLLLLLLLPALASCGLFEELYGDPRAEAQAGLSSVVIEVPLSFPIVLGDTGFALPPAADIDTTTEFWFPPIYVGTEALREAAERDVPPAVLERIERIELVGVGVQALENTLSTDLLPMEFRIGAPSDSFEQALVAALLPRIEARDTTAAEAEINEDNQEAVGEQLATLSLGAGLQPGILLDPADTPTGRATLEIVLRLRVVPRI